MKYSGTERINKQIFAMWNDIRHYISHIFYYLTLTGSAKCDPFTYLNSMYFFLTTVLIPVGLEPADQVGGSYWCLQMCHTLLVA